MRIDSSGQLLMGSSSSTFNVIANQNNAGALHLSGGGSGSANIQIHGSNHSSDAKVITFDTDNAERMRIFSDGVIAMNTTTGWFSRYFVVEDTSGVGGAAAILASQSSVYPLSVVNYGASGDNNLIGFWTDSRSSPTQRGDIDYNRAAGQVRYNVTSDRRLKSNIEPAESAINLLSSIQVRSYTWTESQYKVEYGFVAQELHDHVPDAVKQGDNGDEVVDAWSIDNSKLVPVLTKALQEAIAKIETLESEVATLKNG